MELIIGLAIVVFIVCIIIMRRNIKRVRQSADEVCRLAENLIKNAVIVERDLMEIREQISKLSDVLTEIGDDLK